ncbi:MAG: diacylglycerol kinase family protein [Hymenobacter sp.]
MPHTAEILELRGADGGPSCGSASTPAAPTGWSWAAMTRKLVAEQALAANLPLAVLPAGSANGMAKELNLPLDPIKPWTWPCTAPKVPWTCSTSTAPTCACT